MCRFARDSRSRIRRNPRYLSVVPRPPRMIFPGEYYHVLNRANRKSRVFHSPGDYDAFVRLIARAQEHAEVQVLAVCLMPNHVHFVLRSSRQGDISRWVKWLLGTHGIRYNKQHNTVGHVWQGRFKAMHVQTDQHLMNVMRYVERNASRANLVKRAEQWRWGSLRWRMSDSAPVTLAAPPIELPLWWAGFVNTPQTAAELGAIRTSVNRQRPYGDDDWVKRAANRGSLQQTLRSAGRQRKRRSGTDS
jgi:putative transposase